jgi:hypothetical protein
LQSFKNFILRFDQAYTTQILKFCRREVANLIVQGSASNEQRLFSGELSQVASGMNRLSAITNKFG